MKGFNTESVLALALALGVTSASILRPFPRQDDSNFKTHGGFNPIEASIADVHDALLSKKATCRQIVSSYIARIEKYNPQINAIITLNPKALDSASEIDALLSNNTLPSQNSTSWPSLLCIPTLLKDNFDLSTVPTTGGCAPFASNQPSHDAAPVTVLHSAGAIILGKTNLHELALEGLTVSSAGGQTHNPYDLTRTPGGSSGGSGAALSANFAVLATGSDTMNSLRSPASANAVKSLRPTRWLLNKTGVLPLSNTQDVIGPMAKHAGDLKALYEVMFSAGNAGGMKLSDLDDSLPEAGEGKPPLTGLKFGLVQGFVNYTASDENTPVIDVVGEFTAKLQKAGAQVVNVTDSFFDPAAISALDIQRYEFQEDLNKYLANPDLKSNGPRTFSDLYTKRDDYVVIPAQYQFVQDSFTHSRNTTAYTQAIQNLTNLADTLVQKWNGTEMKDINFLIFPQERNLVKKIGSASQSGRNGHLGALTGFPVLAFPAGYSAPQPDAPRGVPVGFEFLGHKYDDRKLLALAARLEAALGKRTPPVSTEGKVEVKEYDRVPVITPNRTISNAYPLGRIQ